MICQLLAAQSPHFNSHHFKKNHPNTHLELIYEDPGGFIWLGSSNGLFRYDGWEFEVFLKSDSSNNHVHSIYKDRKGIFWIGYKDGSIYLFNKNKLTAWQPEEGTPQVPITGILEDKQGRMWIATYGEGVYVWEEGHLYNFNIDDGLLGDDIYVMKSCPIGEMWLGTDTGINKVSFDNRQKKVKAITIDNGLPDGIVREIIPDAKGNFWIGMYDKGFCYYDFQKEQFDYFLENWDFGIVNQLEIFEEKEIWIGTESNGLWRFDFQTKQMQPIKNEQIGAKVNELHKDIEGNIWIISDNQNLCLSNRQFEYLDTPFANIQSILMDSRNQLWIGTQTGLYTFSRSLQSNRFEKILSTHLLNVISLYEDEWGVIWIGTFGQGVYCFYPPTGVVRHLTEKDGLTNGSVLSIDGIEGQVWLGTLGGVTEFRFSKNIVQSPINAFRNFNQLNGLGTNFIYQVFIDSQKRVWFATDGKGVSVLEGDSLINYNEINLEKSIKEKNKSNSNVKPLKRVYSIVEDREGKIWLSTAKEGLFRYNGRLFQQISVGEGLRNPDVTALANDDNGNLLVINTNGIDWLDISTQHFIFYDNEVGVKDFNPNLNAICKDEKGNVWIAGAQRLFKFTTLKERVERQPRIHLKRVYTIMEDVDFEANNVFSAHQNNLQFEYIGLWYTAPEKVKYRYQISDLEGGWIETKDQMAVFSSLPAGQYDFKVAASINNNWRDGFTYSFPFEILRPVWQRWWFILVVVVLIVVLLRWWQRLRDERLQRVSILEKEKAESQLAALTAQINPHFLFNSFNTLASIIEENPTLAVEFVEKLSDFYRNILQYREQELISLGEELEVVDNFVFLLKKRFGNNLHVEINLDGQQGQIVPLTLQLLIENAVKHNIVSKSKPLFIYIEKEKISNRIIVKNNLQRKIQAERSTRFGLQSLEKQYDLLSKQKMEIQESKDFFTVKVPLIP